MLGRAGVGAPGADVVVGRVCLPYSILETLELGQPASRRAHRESPREESETVASITNVRGDPDDRAHELCAPGRIRTCAPASGGRCSIP